MGKGNRIKAKRKRKDFLSHAQEVLTRNVRKEIRNSALWPQMVAEFGAEKAEELLKECKGELRPGLPRDGSGNGTEDF